MMILPTRDLIYLRRGETLHLVKNENDDTVLQAIRDIEAGSQDNGSPNGGGNRNDQLATIEMLPRERLSNALLTQHGNLSQSSSLASESISLALVFEWCDGGSLFEFLQAQVCTNDAP